DRHVAERGQSQLHVLADPHQRRRRRLVLLDERVRELPQRDVGAVQRAEAQLTQRLLKHLAGLALAAKAGSLPTYAGRVAVADHPGAARPAENLSALVCHATRSWMLSCAGPSHAASTSLHRNRTGRTCPPSRRPGIRPSRKYRSTVSVDRPVRSPT